eukprot:13908-Heterococcus_DN1.PRE.1
MHSTNSNSSSSSSSNRGRSAFATSAVAAVVVYHSVLQPECIAAAPIPECVQLALVAVFHVLHRKRQRNFGTCDAGAYRYDECTANTARSTVQASINTLHNAAIHKANQST